MESMLYVNGEFLSDSEDIIDAAPDNLELIPCQICSRTFQHAALEKHVGICEKMHIQKRTPFDSFRQRREGTELETYLPSNYGLIAKPKTSKLSPTETKSVSRSISSIYSDTSSKISTRRLTPSKPTKIPSKETPLMNRSMNKRSLGPINEICPQCGRSFGIRAFDRHVEWCREKSKIHQPTLSAQQHLAKERMQIRTKYKAPALRTKRDKNREKYSSLSESMNNLSDSGGISIMDFNSVADPYERGRKSSIMSLSMTSSVASDGGFSDKYDPFISAKRQLEDLFNASGIATSTPTKDNVSPEGNMSKSLITKSPSSPTKTQSQSKSTNNFRRTSSLRVPSKRTSPISYMPKYKPTIQRGISDEGPISSNFLKPEEFDELPVKSHAVIPPDLVPKSPRPVSRERQVTTPPTPIVVKRQNSANRRNLCADVKNLGDFPLTKTDSLAAFLKFEDDLECSPSKDENLSEKELKDKSNHLNKKSLSELIDNKMNDSNEDRLPTIESRLQNNPIILAPIEKPLIKHKIVLDPIIANSECNNNNVPIDDNDNSIDSNLINSCDNLGISNLSKLPNESISFDPVFESTDTSIENYLNNSNDSTRDISSAESSDCHPNLELIVNLKNMNENTDKRNPKRQLQLQKDNLLFDDANRIGTTESQIDQVKKLEDALNDNNKNHSSHASSPRSQKINDCNKNSNRKLSVKNVEDIETLFDDFDLEEFISSFSDNEQFPIFKNYKEMISTSQVGGRRQHGSESTSEESEFDDKIDTSDIDVNERERTQSAGSSIEREKSDNSSFLETIKNHAPFEKMSFKKPDLTIETDKQIKFELNKFDHTKHTSDTNKINQLQESISENDGVSQAERELLASVQELNNMCENSNTLNSNLDDVPIKDRISNETEHSFKSLFLNSSSDNSNSGTGQFYQRNRQQTLLSYQVPEIVSSSSARGNRIVGRSKATPLELITLKTDPNKTNTNGTKLTTSHNGFDRVLPPIVVRKNDSQNIYNTINMTSNFHDAQNINRPDSVSNNATDRKLSSSISMKFPKFCHECGAKFIVEQAKFCMECGVKRIAID